MSPGAVVDKLGSRETIPKSFNSARCGFDGRRQRINVINVVVMTSKLCYEVDMRGR